MNFLGIPRIFSDNLTDLLLKGRDQNEILVVGLPSCSSFVSCR